MNNAARRELNNIAIPFEDGYPLRACVIGGLGAPLQLAWAFDGGKRKEGFGPGYATARDASRACRYLNERGTA